MKLMAVALIAGVLPLLGFAAGSDLFYYCTFDSDAAILSPVVGSTGVRSGTTSYQDGKVGKALYVPAGSGVVKVPFPSGIPTEKGCIEFWAQIKSSSSTYADKGDPRFFAIVQEGVKSANAVATQAFNANNGSAQSGICGGLGGVGWATRSSWGWSYPYAQEFEDGNADGWHHYAITWNVNGINGAADAIEVFLDESVIWRCAKSSIDKTSFVGSLGSSLELFFSLPFETSEPDHSKSPFLIDEFKIWKTDRTSFSPDFVMPVVSEVTAKQHYPWCGKIDIGYTVAGLTDGLQVKITVKDNTNDITYEAKTFDVAPTASVGTHTVVWDATKDGVNKVSQNMVATVSLIVPAE